MILAAKQFIAVKFEFVFEFKSLSCLWFNLMTYLNILIEFTAIWQYIQQVEGSHERRES